MRTFPFILAGLVLAASVAAQPIPIEVGDGRSQADPGAAIDRAGAILGRNLTLATARARAERVRAGRLRAGTQIAFPQTALLTRNGVPFPVRGGLSRAPGLTLAFDATGARAFPAAYRQRLQGIFQTAGPLLNSVFGAPFQGGTVRVRNYNVDIADRAAVIGGLYVANGPDGPEIRFPVYNNPETVAVNFVHTLLLAYLGPRSYGLDAWQEGIVRAATMRVVRTPAALPTYDQDQIENVLAATYDTGTTYDWLNQPGLAGRRFIAPNLAAADLPPGGSVGGLYLVRHQMAGSAWQKVLTEDPGFLAEYNRQFFLRPSLQGNAAGLITLAQTVLNARRPEDPRIEGQTAAAWFRRQFIFDTAPTPGPRLLIEPIAILGGLSGTDFGVFSVAAHAFSIDASGNETLASGVAYPMFWEGDAAPNRVFPSAQEDRMDLFGGYGNVGPNLPNLNNGAPYRTSLDIPFQDRIARVYLPAGAVATATRPTPNTFYGTVLVGDGRATDALRVRVALGSTLLFEVPVQNGAFGVRNVTAGFLGSARLTVAVIRRRGGIDTTLLTRRVNKGPGPLALDLRVGGDTLYTLPGGVPRGLSAFGLPITPYRGEPAEALGQNPIGLLLARYNPSRANYDLYPSVGLLERGHGYYVRAETATATVRVDGRTDPGVAVAVAMKPGWNQVTPPLLEPVPTSRIRVIRAAEFPAEWTDAAGTLVGTEFFEFRRSNVVDPASGAPETGTLVPATQFVPGRAYFVRVLAAEGVSLLFEPTTAESVGRSRGGLAASPRPRWLARLSATDGRDVTWVEVGGSLSATRAFDRREDAETPPSLGGFQATVEGPTGLFRDVRRLNSPESFRVRLDGLRPGATYTLRFKPLTGTAPTLWMLDTQTKRVVPVGRGDVYRFTARASRAWFDWTVVGGSR